MKNINNYIGSIINNLKIIKEVGVDDDRRKTVEVECFCENKTIFITALRNIVRGGTKSCGCLRKLSHKKYNTYNLTGEYGVGYSNVTNKEFYFDLEDYEKIKNICWSVNSGDRVLGKYNGKPIEMSKLITNTSSEIVDHKDTKPNNNRKSNLRIVTQQQNMFNRKGKGIMSKFGLKGISWNKNTKKWYGRLTKNSKIVYTKYFINIIDAITSQIEAEKVHFGEYRYAWENNIKWDELLAYERELKKGEII